MRSGPRETVRSIALLICTRGRPEVLQECLRSLVGLERPDGIAIRVCIADNNDTSQVEQILALGRALGLDITCRHQPRRGYSSARNTALDLATEAVADVAILIDDDSVALPDLVTQHLWALDHYQADAIAGAIDGVHRKVVEGQRMVKSGTGNVALRRWIFDPVDGAGLRFDPRLDLLGYEDFEFFRDLAAHGGVVVRSAKPRTRDLGHSGTATSQDVALRLTFARAEGRNDVVVTRIRRGAVAAVSRVVSRYVPMWFRGLGGMVAARAAGAVGSPKARQALEDARYKVVRARSAFGGVTGPGFERQAAKGGVLKAL